MPESEIRNFFTNRITSDDTPYTILGVKTDATDYEIKRAYKKLVVKYHPDKNDLARKTEFEIVFGKISEAYAILSDPERRSVHDSKDVLTSLTADENKRFKDLARSIIQVINLLKQDIPIQPGLTAYGDSRKYYQEIGRCSPRDAEDNLNSNEREGFINLTNFICTALKASIPQDSSRFALGLAQNDDKTRPELDGQYPHSRLRYSDSAIKNIISLTKGRESEVKKLIEQYAQAVKFTIWWNEQNSPESLLEATVSYSESGKIQISFHQNYKRIELQREKLGQNLSDDDAREAVDAQLVQELQTVFSKFSQTEAVDNSINRNNEHFHIPQVNVNLPHILAVLNPQSTTVLAAVKRHEDKTFLEYHKSWLEHAIAHGDIEEINILHAKLASHQLTFNDLETKTNFQPLLFAIEKGVNLEIIQLLIAQGCVPKNGIIYEAAKYCKLPVVSHLYQILGQPDLNAIKGHYNNETPLHGVIRKIEKTFELPVLSMTMDNGIPTFNGTPTIKKCGQEQQEEKLQIVEFLIKHGASPYNVLDAKGRSPIALCIKEDEIEQKIRQIADRYQARDENQAMFSGLFQAISSSDKVNVTRVLATLKTKEIDLNRLYNEEGLNPLMAAANKGDLEIAKLILAYPKVNVKHQTSSGLDALKCAYEEDKAAVVALLIEHGAINGRETHIYQQRFNPENIEARTISDAIEYVRGLSVAIVFNTATLLDLLSPHAVKTLDLETLKTYIERLKVPIKTIDFDEYGKQTLLQKYVYQVSHIWQARKADPTNISAIIKYLVDRGLSVNDSYLKADGSKANTLLQEAVEAMVTIDRSSGTKAEVLNLENVYTAIALIDNGARLDLTPSQQEKLVRGLKQHRPEYIEFLIRDKGLDPKYRITTATSVLENYEQIFFDKISAAYNLLQAQNYAQAIIQLKDSLSIFEEIGRRNPAYIWQNYNTVAQAYAFLINAYLNNRELDQAVRSKASLEQILSKVTNASVRAQATQELEFLRSITEPIARISVDPQMATIPQILANATFADSNPRIRAKTIKLYEELAQIKSLKPLLQVMANAALGNYENGTKKAPPLKIIVSEGRVENTEDNGQIGGFYSPEKNIIYINVGGKYRDRNGMEIEYTNQMLKGFLAHEMHHAWDSFKTDARGTQIIIHLPLII